MSVLPAKGALQMKLATLSALTLLLGSGYALAGAGAPVPGHLERPDVG